jgi:hypothetical protein
MKKPLIISAIIVFCALVLYLAANEFYLQARKNAEANPFSFSQTVIYSSAGFSPSSTGAAVPTTITFKNESSNAFWLISENASSGPCTNDAQSGSCAPIEPGDSWSVRYDNEGAWSYFNKLNPSQTFSIGVYPIAAP